MLDIDFLGRTGLDVMSVEEKTFRSMQKKKAKKKGVSWNHVWRFTTMKMLHIFDRREMGVERWKNSRELGLSSALGCPR